MNYQVPLIFNLNNFAKFEMSSGTIFSNSTQLISFLKEAQHFGYPMVSRPSLENHTIIRLPGKVVFCWQADSGLLRILVLSPMLNMMADAKKKKKKNKHKIGTRLDKFFCISP